MVEEKDGTMEPYQSEHNKLQRENRRLKRKLKRQAALLTSAPASAPAPAPMITLPAVQKIGGKVWWQLGLGLGLAVLAALALMLYTQDNTNMILAILFVFLGAGSMLFLFLGLRKREEGMKVQPLGRRTKSKIRCSKCFKVYDSSCHDECPHTRIICNSLNIYYGYDEVERKVYPDCIKFEELKPSEISARHPQQCLDDGKYYYVHMYDPIKKNLIPFVLPDTQYFSPKEFINPLVMPASRKVLKPKATLGEKLRPVLLVIGIAILAFLFIIQGSPPPA